MTDSTGDTSGDTASTAASPEVPVVVTAIFRPIEGARAGVLAAMAKALPRVHEEPGCNLYAIQEAADGSIVMIEHWESAALLDAHGEADAVRDMLEELSGLLLGPVEVTRLTPIPLGDARKGAVLG